jgi:hypothetical protein
METNAKSTGFFTILTYKAINKFIHLMFLHCTDEIIYTQIFYFILLTKQE